MNCHDFEQLLADAWGGELRDEQRGAFEGHLAACVSCRTAFQEGVQAIGAMQSLGGPIPVTAHREGNRLVLDLPTTNQPRAPRGTFSGALRVAAAILIAFTAGYAFHAGLMMRDAALAPSADIASGQDDAWVDATPSDLPSVVDTERSGVGSQPRTNTLRSALAGAYLRGDRGSDLARCLTALSDSGT